MFVFLNSWPCIFEWMNRGNKACPVCKSSIDREKLIPVYGKGKERKDPRQTNPIPQRPQGMFVCVCLCVCVCVCVCIHMCVCVCVFVCVFIGLF